MNARRTREARTQHSPVLEPVGFTISMVVPVAIAIIGIAVLGSDVIYWLDAIVWGVVATLAFTLFSRGGGLAEFTALTFSETREAM
jgi:hypothetical protein